MVMNYKERLEARFNEIREVTDVQKKKIEFRRLLSTIKIMSNVNEKARTKISFASYVDRKHFLEELRVEIYKEIVGIG